MTRVKQIPGSAATGVFTVVTHTSTYVIDLDEMTLLRAPGIGRHDDESWEVSALRRDSEDIPLLEVRTCRVGEPAQFWVSAVDDPDVRTWRITTPVIEIERIG
ncbi:MULTISPECIES: hypothetical protein [unclassified Gordonia (in: high G+C Gram-positive bacteria)]|uniref:hypothetical protein n=1 Tax=unclassified Gordonia (in: high G+C Gram-positive bacteria) TaxID=2657482 RepID=UPI001FFEEA8C|nr:MULTISPECIES: hypothetical protein [unclassified Gordonia (in: high G+C Gram-positive bacteria)]UQE76734.1 hypothetical protein MYK68_09325 [Gordonia sp. PP30]